MKKAQLSPTKRTLLSGVSVHWALAGPNEIKMAVRVKSNVLKFGVFCAVKANKLFRFCYPSINLLFCVNNFSAMSRGAGLKGVSGIKIFLKLNNRTTKQARSPELFPPQ
jgi:hypothetical protein